MDRATERYIEQLLSDYHRYDTYIKQRELELQYPAEPSEYNPEASKSSKISKPVEQTIMNRQMDIRLTHLEKTKQAIEKVLDQLDSTSYQLVKLTYWTKPQTRTAVGIAREIGYSRSHYFRVKKSIIKAVGIELGVYSKS